MIHPCTIKDPQGNVKRIYTTDFLEERAQAMFEIGDGFFSTKKIRDDICGRDTCKKPFWTKQRMKIYCSKECSLIVQRAAALKTKARAKQRNLATREQENAEKTQAVNH
jgi:hypothetical protein